MVPCSTLPLLATCLAVAQASPPPSPDELRCGAYCLYVATRAMSLHEQPYAEFEKGLGPAPSRGYSLAQLADAARALGAHASPVETTLANLRARDQAFACIAHTSYRGRDHFVLVQDISDDQVTLIDPPRRYTMPRETFEGIWTRKALLIAASPLVAEESVKAPGPGGKSFLFAGLPAILVLAIALVAWRRRRSSRPLTT